MDVGGNEPRDLTVVRPGSGHAQRASNISRTRLSSSETPAMIRQVSSGLRIASGVTGGRPTGRLAPRSSASRNSSAVSKRCAGSLATALSSAFSSQPGMSGR